MLLTLLTASMLLWLIRCYQTTRSAGSLSATRMLGLMLALVLCAIFQPELRLLLLSIQAIGADLFIGLVALQLRHLLAASALSGRRWLGTLCDYGPVPHLRPTRELVRRDPLLAIYAVGWPAALSVVVSLFAFGLARRWR